MNYGTLIWRLETQEYFKNTELNLEDIRITFRYRTRMENFGENFRGGRTHVMCPFCNTHIDSQLLSTSCPIIKQHIPNISDISDIFTNHIKTETIQTIREISRIREEYETKPSQAQVSLSISPNTHSAARSSVMSSS